MLMPKKKLPTPSVRGALMNWLFVRRDVEKIFEYRRQQLLALSAPKQA